MHLDLTKERFTLHQKARYLVKKSVKKISSKIRIIFSSISELLDLTDQQNNPVVLGHGAEGTNVVKNFFHLLFVGHQINIEKSRLGKLLIV